MMLKKHENNEDIQTANTRLALKNLNVARGIIDSLYSSEATELRSLRNQLTSLISELQKPDLLMFNKKIATIEEFIASEKFLVESTANLVTELERQLKEGVDVKIITELINSTKDAINNRIPFTTELKTIYNEKRLPDKVSSELTLYLNILQTKYASYRPETLHTGDYIAHMKWRYHAGENNVTAWISELMATPLVLEARWQDSNKSIVEVVKREAEAVKKNQYKCLCLVNTTWYDETKDFVTRFIHPRLVLYLYELNKGLIYNRDNPAARHYEFWFNTQQKRETLKEQALRFIDTHEYFTVKELANALGLRIEGAETLLQELERDSLVIDVSFNNRVKKYTKTKYKED